MKRLVLGSVSFMLLITLVVPVVKAEQMLPAPSESITVGQPITPVKLVYTAYRGLFERQGIPKFNHFLSDYQSHQLTAEDLVRAAIAAHRLPDSALSDRSYISAVDVQLGFLSRFNH